MEAFYFAFGGNDAVLIIDAPDHASVLAASLVINASGFVNSKTTVLVTAEEIDLATKKTVPTAHPDSRRRGRQ